MKRKYGTARCIKWFTVLCAAVSALLILTNVAAWAEGEMYKGKPAKYLFLFIGDGMGQPQRTAAEAFLTSKNGQKINNAILAMSAMPVHGVTATYAYDRFITDSAAAATALACGVKTKINFIGVDVEGNSVKNLCEIAKDKGMKVGVVSSVSIDHATPACFYAHQPTRKMYHEIAHDLVNSGFEYFGGGGFVDPVGKKSKHPQGDVLEAAVRKGYRIVKDREEFLALTAKDGKILAINRNLPDGSALPYDMDNTQRDITLAEFTSKGIELLDNPKGFFIMVEGGKIDWACHANDAVAAIYDTLAFDNAIAVAFEFYKKHPTETLIVATGDHECGGLTIGFAGTQYDTHFDALKGQRISFQKFTDEFVTPYKCNHPLKGNFDKDILPAIELYFGLTASGSGQLALADYETKELREAFLQTMAGLEISSSQDYLLYGGYDPLTVKITQILNQKAGLGWTSYSHTGVPVVTSAKGVGDCLFGGYYDNTDIAKKIMSVMGHSFACLERRPVKIAALR
ncbi:MAG: alkaline phosphatase [Deltaproteobacteria bacterium]|nr:alkaline phosphatase [Deltaproteobacteria bacterium]